MKAIIAASVLLATVVSGLAIPERLKHGSWYKGIQAQEKAHHASMNYTANTTASWVTMPLNHEDPSMGTFQDRYFIDTTFWDPATGPCMFYLNGEGPLTGSIGGYMAELARDLKACTVSIEHRWYGESFPGNGTNKTLFTQTLNVHSAMADVIFLMNHFSTQVYNKPNLTWFLVGGSYSGGMTVWMNERYPNAFKASWAASGVVRATFAFTEYDGHVKEVTPRYCHEAFSRVTKACERLWSTNKTELQTLFMTGDVSQPNFMASLSDALFSAVQYSTRTTSCSGLLKMPTTGSDWEALNFFAVSYGALFGENFFAMSACRYEPTRCAYNKLSSSSTAEIDSTATAAIVYPNTYSWEWQICSEMAWWITGYPGSLQSGNVSVSWYIGQCREYFYADTFPDTWNFNKKHHGLLPQTTAPIIATQGSDDPWSTTGLYESPSSNIVFNKADCTDCGHCSSMMSPSIYDPFLRPALVEQRQMVKKFLAKHLGIVLPPQ